jgi:short subunit dehydrogenase-like uncharacterized protein
MARTLLLYGANGYSGRLIADELKLLQEGRPDVFRVVLAGRNTDQLQALASELGMEFSVFGLDQAAQVAALLRSLDVDVVINAAGPFAASARCLATAAIAAGCHYTDINGQVDIYDELMIDLNEEAAARHVALVGGAGFWAGASNLLLDRALDDPAAKKRDLGAIRIAMSRIQTFSRGSARTVWQSLRPGVIVARRGPNRDKPPKDTLLLRQEPVGKLDRTFDFGLPEEADRRIASAASLVDTLAAVVTVLDHGRLVRTIESYVDAGLAGRAGYQLGAFLAPLVAVSRVRAVAQQPVEWIAQGATSLERDSETHVVLLQIEDDLRSTVIDWRWETPNVYQFTAQVVVAVAAQLSAGCGLEGWQTPSRVLRPLALALDGDPGALRGCSLRKRGR